MTVLEVAQRIAPRLGLKVPTAVFGLTDQKSVQLASAFNLARDDIFDAYKWSKLRNICSFTGNGVCRIFDQPADYDSMENDAQLWTSRLYIPLRHVTCPDAWLSYETRHEQYLINAWQKIGCTFHFRPALAFGEIVRFNYRSKCMVCAADDTLKERFTADDDTFRLSETLLERAVVYWWKKDRGLDYADAERDYERRKAKLIMEDRGARVISVGKRRHGIDAELALGGYINPDGDSTNTAIPSADYIALFEAAR